jgi:DNA-binding NarL/FixJ family response regulator
MTIRLAIVDDHPMVTNGLVAALATIDDIIVLDRGTSMEHARELLVRDDLDVVLLDVRLEDGNGIQALAERGPRSQPGVIVISSFTSSQYVAASARFGAAGFMVKTVALPTLVAAIRTVHAGGSVFTREQLEKGFVKLTTREREIVRLAMDGFSNKEIGARLGMSPKTIESRLTEIYERYGITNGRIELSLRAAEEGWLDIKDDVSASGQDSAMPDRSRMTPPPAVAPEDSHPAAVKLGRLGGLVGGRARAAKLSPEQRSESARLASIARWGKR